MGEKVLFTHCFISMRAVLYLPGSSFVLSLLLIVGESCAIRTVNNKAILTVTCVKWRLQSL